MRRPALIVALFIVAAGCLVVTDPYGSSTCTKDADCPAVNAYFCASSETWPQVRCAAGEKDCSCQVMFPPPPFTLSDAGVPDAGPPPDYCADIKPILNTTCIFTCHGAQMGYPNSPANFRLDYWATPVLSDGGMGLPGVASQVQQIDSVVYTAYYSSATHTDPSQMPPADFAGAAMTEDQRKTMHRWVHDFGAPLGAGACESDAGMPDGGAPVSFATDLLPLFMSNCGCHTTGTPAAGLSLAAGNAYNQLVNASTSTGCNGGNSKRVVPNSTGTSMLWLKLSNDPAKCNGFEPNGAAQPFNLSNPADFDKITRWIQQGAPNN